jgi:hypothetical protein
MGLGWFKGIIFQVERLGRPLVELKKNRRILTALFQESCEVFHKIIFCLEIYDKVILIFLL